MTEEVALRHPPGTLHVSPNGQFVDLSYAKTYERVFLLELAGPTTGVIPHGVP